MKARAAERRLRGPVSYANVVSTLALVLAVGGGSALAAGSLAGQAKHHKPKPKPTPHLTLNRADKSFISAQIAAGHVAFATSATSAASATNATNATNATSAADATNLGGHPASAYLLGGATGEAWHMVGTTGQPAFQGTWTNLGGGFAPAAFYIDPIGRVHLKGGITSGAANTLVFTLPAGYHPPESLAFAVAAGSPGPTLENVDVLSDGEVITNGTATTVAMDGISFRAS